jgi:inner membrane transporter RhtA
MALLAMTAIQAGNAVAVHLMRVVGAPDAIALRLTFSAGFLCPALRPRVRALLRDLGLPRLLAFGVTVAVMSGSIYGAVSRLPLAIAVTIGLLGPLTVAVVNSRHRYDYAWPVIAFAGVLWPPTDARTTGRPTA